MDEEDEDEQIDVDSDMQLAAVALQNLSCSPASPHFPCKLSHYSIVSLSLSYKKLLAEVMTPHQQTKQHKFVDFKLFIR